MEVPAQEGQLAAAVQSVDRLAVVDQWAVDQLAAVDRLVAGDQSVPGADRSVDRVSSLYAWVESESVMT